MKTLIFSKDKEYYYIKELASGGSEWLSTHKYYKRPKIGWISNVHQYDSYYRAGLPFPFWKVKDGERIQVCEYDERVVDYQKAEDSKC